MVKMINILEECSNAKTIGISGHVRPDGDCVGSCLSLYLYLKKELPDAEIDVLLEQPADIFSCIKDFDKIDTKFSNIDNMLVQMPSFEARLDASATCWLRFWIYTAE